VGKDKWARGGRISEQGGGVGEDKWGGGDV